jgi:predicted ATPase/class 3 adenylate cyclase
MSELPSGTVTFLFSDVEGSTRLAQEHAESWPDLLRRHQDIVRAAIAAHGGEEVSTEGDSFFVAFDVPHEALAAAVEIQRGLAAEPWLEGAELRVRIGIGTGEADIRDGTYVGVAVHRAARIAQAGHGGQILVSSATRMLAESHLPAGTALRALGTHRLKDLDTPEAIHQLDIEGLPDGFPPIRTLAPASSLPAPATRFLGREREIAEVSELLSSSRLLTLTGPGGTGKTRLSLAVAAAVADRFPDGVAFVPLGEITQLELVLPSIAHELGLPDRGGAQPMERILAHLAARRMLLVLDNFEHIVDAAPEVAELLSGAPQVAVLVTSRSALRVYGEREYPVPPLSTPDPARLPALDALARYEAVALFVDRAQAAQPSFALTDANAAAVAEICHRLEGLPLAIELAAARIKLLSPRAIRDRLTKRLDLLAGGARDLPARQQTLRGAIEWSHELLDDGDRRIFAALGVFVGGAGFEAVEEVCRDLDVDVLECLASLVDKSLVRRDDGADGEVRFTMLETIREYALERLEGTGAAEDVRARHAAWYLDLAERAAAVIMGPDRRRWLDVLEQEHGNLRAALGWATRTGRADLALRLASALWRFWQMRGHLVEGLERTRAAIAAADEDEDPACLARALDAAGGLAYWMGDGQTAAGFYEQELELQRRLGDRRGEAWALYSLAFTDMYWGSLRDGHFNAANLVRARERVAAAVAINREIGDELGLAQALWAEANALWSLAPPVDSDDFRVGRRNAEEARRIFAKHGDSFMEAWATYTAALSQIRLGDVPGALRALATTLRVFHDAGDVTGYVLVLDGMAHAYALLGDELRAARLAAAVNVLEERTGTGLNPPNREVLGFKPETLRRTPELAAAWNEGRLLETDAAVRLALEGVPVASPAGEASSGG